MPVYATSQVTINFNDYVAIYSYSYIAGYGCTELAQFTYVASYIAT